MLATRLHSSAVFEERESERERERNEATAADSEAKRGIEPLHEHRSAVVYRIELSLPLPLPPPPLLPLAKAPYHTIADRRAKKSWSELTQGAFRVWFFWFASSRSLSATHCISLPLPLSF